MAPVVFYEEIYDFYTPPFWQTTWFYVSVALFAALLIGLGIYLFIRVRTKPLSAWEWALRELRATTPLRCNTKEDFKKFYFHLTAITKMYLHRRYSWDIDDRTDLELVQFLEQQAFDRDTIQMLQKVAEGALWVKYANMDALKSQAEADWKSIIAMVEHTTPVS
ncbi:MAG: hypothetical protein WC365_03850 [Candidatus Babeliales bacterium]|jgi:hypothetical protein